MFRPQVIIDHDELYRTVYEFLFNDGDVYLDRVLFQYRETTRHKFKTDFRRSYSRVMQRDYGIKEEPELDIDIQYEAITQARQSVKFKEWKK